MRSACALLCPLQGSWIVCACSSLSVSTTCATVAVVRSPIQSSIYPGRFNQVPHSKPKPHLLNTLCWAVRHYLNDGLSKTIMIPQRLERRLNVSDGGGSDYIVLTCLLPSHHPSYAYSTVYVTDSGSSYLSLSFPVPVVSCFTLQSFTALPPLK